MGADVHNGSSLIKVHSGQVGALLSALKFPADSELPLRENLIECLGELDWRCVEQATPIFSFAYDSEMPMDCDQFLQITKFSMDGSFFEERPGDYVQDLQGNSCPGVMRATVENGVLRCRLYALVVGVDGQRTRQMVEEIDPQLI